MGMPQAARRYTVEECWRCPADGTRYELVHGELLVTPAARLRHQDVAGDLYFRPRTYLEDRADGPRLLLSGQHQVGGRCPRAAGRVRGPCLRDPVSA